MLALEQIQQARQRLHGRLLRTPMLTCATLGKALGRVCRSSWSACKRQAHSSRTARSTKC